MPKHIRNPSVSHGHYADQIPDALAPSPLYTQRMAMPANYYALASSTGSSGMPLPSEQQQQQASYDQYSTAPVSMAPTSHRASSGAWTPQEDQQLLAARMQGLNWGQIRDTYFPAKSPNACRKRHERLQERKGADDFDNRRMQQLAKEYMSMRKEIWSGLAARTGEKWNVVEAKCMSNGLKNLQSAARAASRRDRLETGASLTGYDDDSGISGIGLTPVDELDASYSSPSTSSSVSASHGYHLQQHAQAHLQPLNGSQATYGLSSAYGANNYGGHHGYSSSVSSSASAGHVYGNAHQGTSPYMNGQRLSSADMGIEAIINRPGRRV